MRIEGDGAVRELFDAGTLVGLDDAQLLDRCGIGRGESAERAFEVLVRRHGPMVLGVCRRALRDDHAAQDACQATFLVLARAAGSIRRPEALASWLHGVARRVARRARRAADRRRRAEQRAAPGRPSEAASPSAAGDFEALHAEIDRLPGRYREAVVLCDLAGLTHEAAARQLGCPPGTLSARVARGRARLRAALVRRGVGDAGLALLAGQLPAELPAPLAAATARAATIGMAAAGTVPAAVEAWAGGMIMTLRFEKLPAVGLGLVVGAVGLGALALAAPGRGDDPQPQAAPAPPRAVPPIDRGDGPDAAALVRSVREQEAWIDRAESAWFKADLDWEQTPEGIARVREELRKSLPGDDLAGHPSLFARGKGQLELAFDRGRIRSWNRYPWGVEDTRVWDGKRYIGGAVGYEDASNNRFTIAPTMDGNLDYSFGCFAAFRAWSHRFWWTSAADTNLPRYYGTPDDFAVAGRDRRDGVECEVIARWGGMWERFAIADGRLRAIRGGCRPRPDLMDRQVDFLRRAGYEIGDAKAFFDGLSSDRRHEVDRKLAAATLALTEPTTEHLLDDYREVAPGCWFPFRQTNNLLDSGVRYTLTFTKATINEPLPASLFEVPIPAGVEVVDLTGDPPVISRPPAGPAPER